MPLSKGCTPRSFKKNIRTLAHERPDMSPKQRVAVALNVARRSGCAVPRNPNRMEPLKRGDAGWFMVDVLEGTVQRVTENASESPPRFLKVYANSSEAAYQWSLEQRQRRSVGRRNRLDATISKNEYDSLRDRHDRYQSARKRFSPSRFARGGGYSSDEVAEIEKMAGVRDVNNDERALMETYDWIHNKPDHAFLYYNKEMTEIRGFMSNKMGDIVRRGPEVRRMGGRTQSVQVLGKIGRAHV